jgi:hypothetical protein
VEQAVKNYNPFTSPANWIGFLAGRNAPLAACVMTFLFWWMVAGIADNWGAFFGAIVAVPYTLFFWAAIFVFEQAPDAIVGVMRVMCWMAYGLIICGFTHSVLGWN